MSDRPLRRLTIFGPARAFKKAGYYFFHTSSSRIRQDPQDLTVRAAIGHAMVALYCSPYSHGSFEHCHRRSFSGTANDVDRSSQLCSFSAISIPSGGALRSWNCADWWVKLTMRVLLYYCSPTPMGGYCAQRQKMLRNVYRG